MYAGQTQFCNVILSSDGCSALAKTEAVVQTFSYSVILILVVPITIVLFVDLVFYIKELLAQANYKSITKTPFFDSVASVDFVQLLPSPLVIARDNWNFTKADTLYRMKTFFEVSAIVIFLSISYSFHNSVKPVSEISPLVPRGKMKHSSRTSKKSVKKPSNKLLKIAPNIYNQYDDDSSHHHHIHNSAIHSTHCDTQPIYHPLPPGTSSNQTNVFPLYCSLQDTSPAVKDSGILLKGITFVSLRDTIPSSRYWEAFRLFWSSFLRNSRRLLEGLAPKLKFQDLNKFLWLSPNGIGFSSILNSRATLVSFSSSRLANKRHWVRLMGQTQ